MIRAYDEIVDFIAAGSTIDQVAQYQASQATRENVEQLLAKEKLSGLNAEEASELEHYLRFEHVMRLAKARARERIDEQLRQQ